MQDADTSSDAGSRTEDSQTEGLFVHRLGAREGEEYATRTDLPDSLGVDTLVTTQGIAYGVAMLGKSRRIEDDQIIICDFRFMICDFLIEEIEGIDGIGMMTRVVGEVASHVDIDQVDGFLADIDRIDSTGTATQGIEREASGVAEHIEHVLATRIALDEGTVLTLVNKEAGLLATQPINAELETILGGPEVGFRIYDF